MSGWWKIVDFNLLSTGPMKRTDQSQSFRN